MPNYTTSSNMSLTIPIPGLTPGPEYASLTGACLTTIDGHDHSSGKGVPVTPNGINISSDLSFGGNNATVLRSVRFSPQNSALGGASDIGCLYEVGVDLYYNDGDGNQIRITQSGSVTGSSGTITGLPSGTASASYQSISGTFRFQSATNTPANIDGASIVIRNQTASSNGITLSAPTALASNFGIVLPPSVPASQKFMTMNSSGEIGVTLDVDNSTLQISGNVLKIKPSGVGTTELAPASVTFANLAPGAGTFTGEIKMCGNAVLPTGFLWCDGAQYLKGDYPALYAAIGDTFGSPSSLYFNVPDMRGRFPRGTDNGAGRDPNSGTRTAMNANGNTGDNVGSVQGFATSTSGVTVNDPTHTHGVPQNIGSGILSGATTGSSDGLGSITTTAASTGITLTGASETRPINAYLNFVIKT